MKTDLGKEALYQTQVIMEHWYACDLRPVKKTLDKNSSWIGGATGQFYIGKDAVVKGLELAGSGTTVTAGKTLTTWTIQPAKGLAAGTYKGTITITYDNGATSTFTVTFTVNKASETNASSSNTNTTKTSSVNTGATSGIMEWGIAFILAVMIAAYAWLSLKHQIIE